MNYELVVDCRTSGSLGLELPYGDINGQAEGTACFLKFLDGKLR